MAWRATRVALDLYRGHVALDAMADLVEDRAADLLEDRRIDRQLRPKVSAASIAWSTAR
jgi:hypothetical protein